MDATSFESLPFEMFRRILSYSDLQEILRLRAVCKKWCVYIDNFSLTSLFFSEYRRDCLLDKDRLTNGFAQNFIQSPRFEWFFHNFTTTLFSSLRRLRVYGLDVQGRSPAFVKVLNSFNQLQDLTIIEVENLHQEIQLNLPSLQNVRFEQLSGIERLVLIAPNLSKIKIFFDDHMFALNFVHTESIESIELDRFVSDLYKMKLRNLKTFYCAQIREISETFLADIPRLEAIHLNDNDASLISLYRQKYKYHHCHLKIYYKSLSFDQLDQLDHLNSQRNIVSCMTKYPSRLAEQLPLFDRLFYGEIESILPKLDQQFWRQFTRLSWVLISSKVADDQQFLEFLGKFDSIVKLSFLFQPQSADLFGRLNEYCPSVQQLRLVVRNLDLGFVFTMRNLVRIVCMNVDETFVRRVFSELEFVRYLVFEIDETDFIIKHKQANLFTMNVNFQKEEHQFNRLDDLILQIKKTSQELSDHFI